MKYSVATADLQRLQAAIEFHHRMKQYYFVRFTAYDRLRTRMGCDHMPLMDFYQEMFNVHFNAWTLALSRLQSYERLAYAYVDAFVRENGLSDAPGHEGAANRL